MTKQYYHNSNILTHQASIPTSKPQLNASFYLVDRVVFKVVFSYLSD